MTESMRVGLYSLRFKFALACIVVESVVLAVMVWNSNRIAENSLHEVFHARVQTLVPLLNVSLTNPLLQRDYATLDERLGRIVQPDSLVYIEVRDELNQPVAQRGDVPQTSGLDTAFDAADGIYDQTFDITLAGRVIGHARYGLNISVLKATQNKQRTQGMALVLGAMALTFLLLAVLAHVFTRRLRELVQAAHAIQAGDYSVRIAEGGRDEVAVAALAFNAMAQTIERDIAERTQAEQALKQSEQRLRNIINGLGPSMFVGLLTLDGAVLEANQQALAAANLELKDVLGMPVEETVWFGYSDEVKQQMRAAVERAAHGEASRFDVPIRGAENQIITLDFSMQPFRDESGQVTFLVPSAIVITERKQVEDALRESEQRLHLALDAAQMGIFEWDVRHDRITWTHWQENLMMGVKPANSGNSYDVFAQRVLPQDLPGINTKIAHCIAEREPFMHEFRVIWPDASDHWIFIRGEFTFADDGQPQRLLGVAEDITARKLTEEKIRSQLDELMRWQQVTLGRENRVREMKAEVNVLLAQQGEPVRYPSARVTFGDQ